MRVTILHIGQIIRIIGIDGYTQGKLRIEIVIATHYGYLARSDEWFGKVESRLLCGIDTDAARESHFDLASAQGLMCFQSRRIRYGHKVQSIGRTHLLHEVAQQSYRLACLGVGAAEWQIVVAIGNADGVVGFEPAHLLIIEEIDKTRAGEELIVEVAVQIRIVGIELTHGFIELFLQVRTMMTDGEMYRT